MARETIAVIDSGQDMDQSVTTPLPGDCVTITKTRSKQDGGDDRGCWTACREAACQKINETLPKVLERQPFTYEIQTLHAIEITQFSASTD